MACYTPATITPVLAAGTSAATPFYLVNISQKLCSSSCVNRTPVFAPAYTLVNFTNIGVGQYVATIHVEGLISYVPCNGNPCCTKSQLISQDFTVPFYSATAPTSVTLAQGSTVNAIAGAPCQQCSRAFVSETPVTITITA